MYQDIYVLSKVLLALPPCNSNGSPPRLPPPDAYRLLPATPSGSACGWGAVVSLTLSVALHVAELLSIAFATNKQRKRIENQLKTVHMPKGIAI